MKNTIFKIISIVFLFSCMLQGNTPSEIASSIHVEKNTVEQGENLVVVLTLKDTKFNDILDANPTLIFDGNRTTMEYSMKQYSEQQNLYFFTVQALNTNTHINQDVNITVTGNYKGEAYVFSAKSVTVSFK